MHESVSLKMTLPKIPDIELVAVEGLERLGHHMAISEANIGEAKILVTEAVINALEHSGEKNPSVRVEFSLAADELVIFVRDYGEGFEPSSIDDPNLAEKLGTKNKRGWGLKLMRELSDDLKIESNKRGTKITITKHLR
jgi:anti-sigma regulatory factor (Ser/Thr protein kinase)